MLAFSLDNLLFLLLIAVAGLFQLLSKTISKAGKGDSNETSSSSKSQTPRPVQRAPRESDADRIRKFLEALGQPPSSTPPPPVAPRTDIPPRPLAPVQPPPVFRRAWGFSREQQPKPEITHKESPPPEQPSRLKQIVPSPVLAPATPAFEVHDVAVPLEVQRQRVIKMPFEASAAVTRLSDKRTDLKADIASLLASESGLREAIIL